MSLLCFLQSFLCISVATAPPFWYLQWMKTNALPFSVMVAIHMIIEKKTQEK